MISTFFRGLLTLTLAFGLWATTLAPGMAQEEPETASPVYIQIESYPALAAAEPRARAYAQILEDVNGLRAGTFYAIALGPYIEAEAEDVLATLIASGTIPADSFLQEEATFTAQFFPVGADTLQATVETAPETLVDEGAEPETADEPVIAATVDPAPEAEIETAADLEAALEEDAAEADVATEAEPEATVDAAPAETATETAPAAEATETETVVVAEPEPLPEPEPQEPREETLEEARESERDLTREERDAIQIAMQFFGFYDMRIDGAFGPGTRAAMSAWQEARGYEPTGVLTTSQRAQLLGEREAELARFGLETVRDEDAGIEIDLPLGLVRFDTYNFPFAQYEQRDNSGIGIMLISQPGDRATLFGLYEIMQTLEMVPVEGERERGRDSFLLTGQSATLRSHTEARLVGGAVKGFTIVWEPRADEDVAFILPIMQDSIDYFAGALDPAFVPEGAGEDIDLVSGLEVRRAERIRSGFYIDGRGTVLTTIEAVETEAGRCERVLIDNAYPSQVTYADPDLGLAVLRPTQPLAPVDYARILDGPAQVRNEIAVAGFPFDGALTAASTSFGTLDALSGVDGDREIQRLSVRTATSEAGGPVIDMSGAVVGMILPNIVDGRALPEEVTLALRFDQLGDAFAAAGIAPETVIPDGSMNRETISRLAADIAVQVSCWN